MQGEQCRDASTAVMLYLFLIAAESLQHPTPAEEIDQSINALVAGLTSLRQGLDCD